MREHKTKMIQAHIFYSGMVQGVGFRYTVHRLAQGQRVTGWVRNLSDGRVEITVEGGKEVIETLMQKIEDHFGGYVRDRDVMYMQAGGQFKDFSIVR